MSRPHRGGAAQTGPPRSDLFAFIWALVVRRDLNDPTRRPRRVDLRALRARDPAFDPERFLEKASEAFLAVQAAWSAEDLSPVRRVLSDGVTNRFSTYLGLNALQGQRNVLSSVKVVDRRIVAVRLEGAHESLTVRFTASCVDQYQDRSSGAVLRGAASPVRFTERWTFLRSRDVSSRAVSLLDRRCPSCGSPLVVAQTARCESCGVLVNSGAHDWVLAEITQDGPNLDATDAAPDGADALTDLPDGSVQLLEDRASAAFWSVLDAAVRRAPARTRRMLTPAQYASFAADPDGDRSAAVDVGVGEVRALRVDAGPDGLTAAVQVAWSGTRVTVKPDGSRVAGEKFHRTDVLTFARQFGAAPIRGLVTLGCGACGGPLDRSDQGACPWCDTPLDPVPTDWLLSDGLSGIFDA